MRVFDTYYFNIADKVSFSKTKPYLEKMLTDLGFAYKNIGFTLYDLREDTQKKALAKLPQLEKYKFFSHEEGNYPEWGFTSCTENWREGELHADKADDEYISALFSKIPHTLNFAFGYMLLDGINWFPDSVDTIAADADCRYKLPTTNWLPFRSNHIEQFRDFDDGRKYNRISVCIEVTDKDRPRDSKAVIEKLMPYLGEPQKFERKCVFPKEEAERFKALAREECERLSELAKSTLPESKPHKPWTDPQAVPPPDPKLPHVADKFTLDKAFKNTGFVRQKGQPNWLSLYSYTDERGFIYDAYVQKLSYFISNDFRVWLEISGCNFKIATREKDYYVTEDGESLEILKKFSEFCVNLRGEFAGELAEKFGDTPEWYNEKPQ